MVEKGTKTLNDDWKGTKSLKLLLSFLVKGTFLGRIGTTIRLNNSHRINFCFMYNVISKKKNKKELNDLVQFWTKKKLFLNDNTTTSSIIFLNYSYLILRPHWRVFKVCARVMLNKDTMSSYL